MSESNSPNAPQEVKTGSEYLQYIDLVNNFNPVTDQAFIVFCIQTLNSISLQEALDSTDAKFGQAYATTQDPAEGLMLQDTMQKFAAHHNVPLPKKLRGVELKFLQGMHGLDVRFIADNRLDQPLIQDTFALIRMEPRGVYEAVITMTNQALANGALARRYQPLSDENMGQLIENLFRFSVVFAFDMINQHNAIMAPATLQ